MNPKIQKVDLQNLDDLKVSFPASNPFENLEYFHAMESSNSASEKSGWIPNHLGELNNDTLNSFCLYIKNLTAMVNLFLINNGRMHFSKRAEITIQNY